MGAADSVNFLKTPRIGEFLQKIPIFMLTNESVSVIINELSTKVNRIVRASGGIGRLARFRF